MDITGEGLVINDSLIPGKFIEISGKIWMTGDEYVVEVEKGNIKHYLSHGTLWWGIKSLLVEGVMFNEFITLRMEKTEAMNRLSGARYASLLPEEYSYTYRMWISENFLKITTLGEE